MRLLLDAGNDLILEIIELKIIKCGLIDHAQNVKNNLDFKYV